MSLRTYHQKRNFKKTAEPKGTVKASSHRNIYLIQKHAASHLHYDFRLELNGVLKSWAVPKGPCLDPTVKRLAMHVEDHPLDYATFEGIIPKGEYGGGTVMLWDQGTWECEGDAEKAYQAGNMKFILKGKKLKGAWKLIRIKADPKSWLLIKIEDKYAKPLSEYDITVAQPNSVVSKQSLDEIAENYKHVWGSKGLVKAQKKSPQKDKIILDIKSSKMPMHITPALATLVNHAPAGDQWLHEIKFDGYRLLAYIADKEVRLITRGNQDWTEKFEGISKALKKLSIKNAIFDGEIVVLDKHQHSDFQLLQNSIKEHEQNKFIYYLFDLLYLDNKNLMSLPLLERKEMLHQLIPQSDQGILRYSDHVLGAGEEIFTNACQLGLEGIVSKKIVSVYEQRRGKNWLKVKCSKRQEFVIGGYTHPKASRKYFGSLLLGYYDENKKLIYCGHVGTGFNANSLEEINKLLKKHHSEKIPFNTNPPGIKHVKWVKPILVCEVEFSEWTSDGVLRHPSFKGLRTDKAANLIKKEMPITIKSISKKKITHSIEKKSLKKIPIKITHPEKILYPEAQLTKLDLVEYYYHIQKWILPYVIDRPLTLVRCPEGYTQECFYQKHINKNISPYLHEILIKEKDSINPGLYIKDVKGLLMLSQWGTLEIHTWNSKVSNIEKPDMFVFDLDPAPDVRWERVVEAAFEVKENLEKLNLKSFVKTAGGKGLHVVVPIKPHYSWEEIKNFTHAFVDAMVTSAPKKYIGKMTKLSRKGKIFLDYLRNQRGATAVAPYSTRARKDAPIATPLSWQELTDDINDTFYTVKTIFDRLNHLKQDPWKDFLTLKQALKLEKIK